VQIIPVVDIMSGYAVHARCGNRDQYELLNTPLSKDANPFSVESGLLGLGDFKAIYIADLDALMGKTPQYEIIRGLVLSFVDVEFWIDGGLTRFLPANHSTIPCHIPVIGSESLSEDSLFILSEFKSQFVLSLDFRDGSIIGPERLLVESDLWPKRVILMNLTRVGSGKGPDLTFLNRFTSRHQETDFYAAGGIRCERDIEILEKKGISGALVATCLHSGAISGETLRKHHWG
jgi:phosphoribosylformimino-5-aminoimidazole carboxamide ribotide isomerase